MKCSKCETAAPENLVAFPSTPWICEKCSETKDLLAELTKIYTSGYPGRYLYISEFTNNLDKVQTYFLNNLDMNNPYCSVTLSSPIGIIMLPRAFDGVYIDKGSLTEAEQSLINLVPGAFIKYVDPTTQNLMV